MKKKIIAGVIILPIVVLFAMWFVNKQQNERQYAEDLAVRFDETMKASYPMLTITTTAYTEELTFGSRMLQKPTRTILVSIRKLFNI